MESKSVRMLFRASDLTGVPSFPFSESWKSTSAASREELRLPVLLLSVWQVQPWEEAAFFGLGRGLFYRRRAGIFLLKQLIRGHFVWRRGGRINLVRAILDHVFNHRGFSWCGGTFSQKKEIETFWTRDFYTRRGDLLFVQTIRGMTDPALKRERHG